MKIGNTIRGEFSIELTKAEIRILRTAGKLSSTIGSVIGEANAQKFIRDCVISYEAEEAAAIAAKAVEAGIAEEESPILKRDRKLREAEEKPF